MQESQRNAAWFGRRIMQYGSVFLFSIFGFSPLLHAANHTIVAGGVFSCQIVDQGVRCWGANDLGQLGNPNYGDTDKATAVLGLEPGTNAGVVSLAAGNRHACALLSSGEVACWGNKDKNRLGLGDNNPACGSMNFCSSPVKVPGLSSVVAIAAGFEHTCALKKGGTVECWGDGSAGQLGLGKNPKGCNGGYDSSPTPVPLFTSAIAITAGFYHTCVVLSSKKVECWGSNLSGQLGLGSLDECNGDSACYTPTPLALLDVRDVAAGDFHTCALHTNGNVKCWGDNGNGQLGLGDLAIRKTPSLNPYISSVSAIAAGPANTCAVIAGGVKCWGAGQMGQLGTGGMVDKPFPTQVWGLNPSANALNTEVAIGYQHACARYLGQTTCWGNIDRGMLGIGKDNRVQLPELVSNQAVKQITTGLLHSCALLQDGSVQCWGRNDQGQLGDGSTLDAAFPKTAIASGVISIATGDNHNCALLSDRTVKCWGDSKDGKLGVSSAGCGGSGHCSAPIQVVGLSGVESLTAGALHTCALLQNRTVKCWGDNSYGQLGLGTWEYCNGGTDCDNPTPMPIPSLSNVKIISAGQAHTCAVLTDGFLKCWGDSSWGQLGTALECGQLGQCDSPVPTASLSNVTSVSAGGGHTCAVLANGSVKCWGRNWYGELGLADTENRPHATSVPGLSGISSISLGRHHTCAIQGGLNTAMCWGLGFDGQLGNGTVENGKVPHPIGVLSNVPFISAGDEHTCAISTGLAYCWGNQLYGRLGNFHNGLATAPVPVIDNN